MRKDINNKVIAIDFDSTIFTTRNLFPYVGDPIPGAINAIKFLDQKGYWLILWTCRDTEEQLGYAKAALKKWGIYECFDKINENLDHMIEGCGWSPRKVFADYYIDDRICPPKKIEEIWNDVLTFFKGE